MAKKNGVAPNFKIENGIPLPGHTGIYGQISDVLRKLQVDQSVLFPMYTRTQQLGSVRSIIQAQLGIKLASRAVEGGIRVWRVS